MAVLYVDSTVSDDTGSQVSSYFSEQLGIQVNAYQSFVTASDAGALGSGDTIHVAPGTYTVADVGGSGYQRYIKVYGTVRFDGAGEGDVHGLKAQFNGWVYFQPGTADAFLIFQNYEGTGGKQILYGTPGLFSARGVKIGMIDSPNMDGVRLYMVGSYTSPEHYFDYLVAHDLRYLFYGDQSDSAVTCTVATLATNKIDRVAYLLEGDGNMTLTINQALLGRSEGYHVYASSAFAGTCVINNAISVGGSTPHADVAPFTLVAGGGGTVTINNSIICPSPRFANTTSGTTDSELLTAAKKVFSAPFSEGSVSLMIDDTKNSEAFEALLSVANAEDVKVGWAMDRTFKGGDATDARWEIAKSAVEAGHAIYMHTTDSANMGSLFAMRVVYTGSGAACSLSISDNALTTSVTGDTDELSLDLREYADVEALVTAINAASGYSAETFDTNSTRVGSNLGATATQYAGDLPPDVLGTQVIADIKTAAVDVSYDTTLFYTREITDNKTIIEEKTGYATNALVYPGGNHAAANEETLEGYGVDIARLTLPKSGSEQYYDDDVSPLALTGWPADTIAPKASDEAERKTILYGFFNWVMMTGAKVSLWAHGLSDYAQDDWELLIQAAKEVGVDIKTLDEQATSIREGTRSVSSGAITYSKSLGDAWINYVESNPVYDGFAGSAAGKKWWSGLPPAGVNGKPFADFETSVGPFQSANTENNPTKV